MNEKSEKPQYYKCICLEMAKEAPNEIIREKLLRSGARNEIPAARSLPERVSK
jgi:hypothetical protein